MNKFHVNITNDIFLFTFPETKPTGSKEQTEFEYESLEFLISLDLDLQQMFNLKVSGGSRLDQSYFESDLDQSFCESDQDSSSCL